MAEAMYGGKPASFFKATGGKPVEGAWYGNQRWLGGRLLAPNEHQPGQQVSAEVNAQSARAQGKDVQEFQNYATGGKPGGSSGNSFSFPSVPDSSSKIQQYLNDYQSIVQKAKDTLNAPEKSDDEIFSQIRERVVPKTAMPEAPNMVNLFNEMRTDAGIQGLEASLTNIKDQETALQDQLFAQRFDEQGKPVGMNVISGRIGEAEQQAMIRANFLGRQKQRIVDELTVRYSLIDSVMRFTQQDFTNAMSVYETEFTMNLQIYDAFSAEKESIKQDKREAAKTILDATGQMIEWEREDEQNRIRNASANLTFMANLIKDGNLSYDQLSPEEQLNIQKLEIQSGLGVGFMARLRSDNPNGKVLYAGANGAVMQMPDGSLKTVNYNVSGGGSGGSKEQQSLQLRNEAASDAQRGVTLKDMLKLYNGLLDNNDIYYIYNQNSRYGVAKETPEQLERLGIKIRQGDQNSNGTYNNFVQ